MVGESLNLRRFGRQSFILVGKPPGPDGYPMAFFLHFWGTLKEDVIAFLNEFHARGTLSKGMCASFIWLIPKKEGEIGIKDHRPISLIGSAPNIISMQ